MATLLDREVESLRDYIPLPKIAAELEKHPFTLQRWCDNGIGGVKLRYVKLGRTRATTRLWLADFFDRLTTACSGEDAKPTVQNTKARVRDLERVDAELAAAGI